MNNAPALIAARNIEIADEQHLSLTEQIIRYYEEAGIDYEHWSSGFNMHFGYYRWGTNPFAREQMLEQMNREIAERLRLKDDASAFLADLGCGCGATVRHIAKKFKRAIVKGATIVPWQVAKAAEMNQRADLQTRVEICKADYTALPFADASVDGAWALESVCHSEGASKRRVVGELARVLKPGARFVIADCFIKNSERDFNFLMKPCYRAICKNWVLPEMASLDEFVAALEKHNLRDIAVEDISWRIAPSVAHAPFAVATFILKKLFAGETLKQQSINNLKGSLMALLLGLNRSKFSYCIISGKRADD